MNTEEECLIFKAAEIHDFFDFVKNRQVQNLIFTFDPIPLLNSVFIYMQRYR